MANTFRSYGQAAVGIVDTTVYTVPAVTQSVILGITVANIIASTINASVKVTKSSGTYFIVKNAPVLVGSALEAIGDGSKFVVEAGDIIKVVSDTAASIDATVSCLEIT